MTDYTFDTHVLRDQMADQLTSELEQTPYVFAKIASDIHPGTSSFDEFCDIASSLSEDDKTALQMFCEAVAETLLAKFDEDAKND